MPVAKRRGSRSRPEDGPPHGARGVPVQYFLTRKQGCHLLFVQHQGSCFYNGADYRRHFCLLCRPKWWMEGHF
ncbi:Hypothetical predicted protein [Podarcis lilfordi]|uniref:Uncharacterized protein n=1 Tax=Podarcis lilfordi TaxID=74358 RepID=A0AA35LFL3_9SAUR|nr:Hypothetical predicted protein [Podarcis lilfordi]